jgi:polysaccharide biosynthesis/export protein
MTVGRRCRYSLGAALAISALLTGCTHLPSSAPTASEFEHPDPAMQQPGYLLVTLDPAVAQGIARDQTPGLATFFGLAGYRPSLALRPGDTIAVTIFEFSPISLLGATPPPSAAGTPNLAIGGHMAAIPPQKVELNGTISVPFGGQVKVGGLTPEQAGQQIARSLKGKATDPQVVVSVVSTLLDAATVGGDVQTPGLIPLTVRAERVLDVVAAAGGSKYSSYDSDVQLVRGGKVARINLQRLVDRPDEDVTVQPGDGVFLTHNPRSFSVLGSALKVSQYDFNTEHVSLAEAIARSGGPNDLVADVGDIYLLRWESRTLVESILTTDDQRRKALELAPPAQPIPVAYHLDLRRGGGYFLAQAVQMRDKDVILVTNADAVELQKLLGIVRGFTGIFYDLKRVGR